MDAPFTVPTVTECDRATWRLRCLMEKETLWLLKFIRRGEADKAAHKAQCAGHYANAILKRYFP